MVLPIYLYGNKVLKQKGKDIGPDFPALHKLIEDMWDTMYFASGVGIAAPQIGLPIRLFVVDSTPYYEDKDVQKGIKKVFINAEILEEFGKEWAFEEGCLSIPKIHAEVRRTTHVRIKYLDENFIPHEEVFDEINARVIQHEYDHIDGILFVERVAPVRRQLLMRKLAKIQKGQYEAKYPVKV
ncbi:MAG: peptide deformylase [Saprospiraceae bacterium]|nr:peptide deformylase [Candidatus Vicinibacter affinis]MBK7696430.1 peptide deformylase [Candidatus Vicinibacter affinis]MBK8405460.1 peptide deformylase [Candidatus Vicinibacter affinis]MBK9641959.1 peptide deformylase [Candidatus Vicinibacter affinis]HQX44221.1 peptide deformylase [Saprospiraceae bacterium]